jgi:chorismate mutase
MLEGMRPSDPEQDPVVRGLREQISERDRVILAAVNERIGLVAELREHKLAQGWDFLDSGREERLLGALAAENPGPLTEEGLRELFTGLLALTKRELGT